MEMRDLIFDVSNRVPGKSENEILWSLRRTYAKFLSDGNFDKENFIIDLVDGQLEYFIDTPVDTYIKSITKANRYDFVFDGLKTVTFALANFEAGAKLELEAILGYGLGATSFHNMALLERYYEGVVNGACALLDIQNAKHYNKFFHNALSEAMSNMGTFTGVKG